MLKNGQKPDKNQYAQGIKQHMRIGNRLLDGQILSNPRNQSQKRKEKDQAQHNGQGIKDEVEQTCFDGLPTSPDGSQ